MKIINDYPPNFDAIKAAFPVRGRGVIYCYGPAIYNPEGVKVAPRLIAHESIHSQRQGRDPAGWWEQYLEDPLFRLAEEILAHRAEYAHVLEHGNRNEKRQAAKQIAARLAGPLYGRLLRLADAKRAITMESPQQWMLWML